MAATLEQYLGISNDFEWCDADAAVALQNSGKGAAAADNNTTTTTSELFQLDDLCIDDELAKIPNIADASIERSMQLAGVEREQSNFQMKSTVVGTHSAISRLADEPFTVAGYQHIQLAADHFDLIDKMTPSSATREQQNSPANDVLEPLVQVAVEAEQLVEENVVVPLTVEKVETIGFSSPPDNKKSSGSGKKKKSPEKEEKVSSSSKGKSSAGDKKKGKKSKWNKLSMDDIDDMAKKNRCNYTPK